VLSHLPMAAFDQRRQRVKTQINIAGIDPTFVRRLARWIAFVLMGGMVLAVALVTVRLITAPSTMPGSLKVAVAEFDTQGSPTSSTYGKLLSDSVGRALADRFLDAKQKGDPLVTPFTPQVWYPGLDAFAKRVDVRLGAISDDHEARQLLTTIRADFLIYGTVRVQGSSASVQPDFFVGEDIPSDDAQEIVGAQRLGSPIPVTAPLKSESVDADIVKGDLQARLEVLGRFTVGLAYDQRGNNVAALAVFRDIEQNLKQRFRDWPENEGQEVLYLFIGREEAALGNEEAATKAFKHALDIRSDYVRAQIGLGNLAYARATKQTGDLRRKAPDMAEAIAKYTAAVQMAAPGEQDQKSPPDRVTAHPTRDDAARAHLALANADLLESQAYLNTSTTAEQDLAVAKAALALGEARQGLALAGEQTHRSLAYGYYDVGQASDLIAQVRLRQNRPADAVPFFRAAAAAYDQCRVHVAAAPSQHSLQGLEQNYCLPSLHHVENALRDLGVPAS